MGNVARPSALDGRLGTGSGRRKAKDYARDNAQMPAGVRWFAGLPAAWPGEGSRHVRQAPAAICCAAVTAPDSNDFFFSNADLVLAFDLAPVGLCVLRKRIIQHCNEAFGSMFGYQPEELVGRSTEMLYPSQEEFERIGARGILAMRECGRYADERIMRFRDGRLFWCHVSGRSLDRADPFSCGVWMWEDISARRPVIADLTVRERQIAQLLVEGMTSKQIARVLEVSPRTIDAHRVRLLRKLKVNTPTEMVSRLAGLTESSSAPTIR